MTDRSDNKNKTARILIVEDDASIRNVLQELLEGGPNEVWVAGDGERAITYLQDDKFDLLITDLGLPGISGWELAAMARRYYSDIRVVAITSWRGPEVESRMQESDLDAIIWKPFRLVHLREALDRFFPDIVVGRKIANR